MWQIQKILASFLLLLIIIAGAFFLPENVQAARLTATPIAQRFTPNDTNGDAGVHNCMAAALTTSLLALQESGQLTGERELSYATVRRLVRSWSPDVSRGIAPSVLITATPLLTDGQFQLTQQLTDGATWREFLTNELIKGYPVIVHIPDRNSLYMPDSQTNLSHVVVVYAIDNDTVSFTDSWDGRKHSVPPAVFEAAWGTGNYRWVGFTFVKQQGSTKTPPPAPKLAVMSHTNSY